MVQLGVLPCAIAYAGSALDVHEDANVEAALSPKASAVPKASAPKASAAPVMGSRPGDTGAGGYPAATAPAPAVTSEADFPTLGQAPTPSAGSGAPPKAVDGGEPAVGGGHWSKLFSKALPLRRHL